MSSWSVFAGRMSPRYDDIDASCTYTVLLRGIPALAGVLPFCSGDATTGLVATGSGGSSSILSSSRTSCLTTGLLRTEDVVATGSLEGSSAAGTAASWVKAIESAAADAAVLVVLAVIRVGMAFAEELALLAVAAAVVRWAVDFVVAVFADLEGPAFGVVFSTVFDVDANAAAAAVAFLAAAALDLVAGAAAAFAAAGVEDGPEREGLFFGLGATSASDSLLAVSCCLRRFSAFAGSGTLPPTLSDLIAFDAETSPLLAAVISSWFSRPLVMNLNIVFVTLEFWRMSQ